MAGLAGEISRVWGTESGCLMAASSHLLPLWTACGLALQCTQQQGLLCSEEEAGGCGRKWRDGEMQLRSGE